MDIALVYILDLIFGDPDKFFHPVRVIGRLVNFLEKRLRDRNPAGAEKAKGVAAAVLVVGLTWVTAYLFLAAANGVNFFLGVAVWIYLGYTTISVKDLRVKASKVYKSLKNNSLPQARKDLAAIVGRDTRDLDEKGVIKAAVESVAESTTDGIVAPLFYLILGGPPLALAYKAVNTLDSMIGYKNDKYINFGWFAAKLDDVANFIPARICGFLTVVVSFSLGKGFKKPFKAMLKDARKHPSPNSGLSEAAFAASLGLKLGGPCYYQGKLCSKPYLGEAVKPVEPKQIKEALVLSFGVSLLAVILGVFFRWVI